MILINIFSFIFIFGFFLLCLIGHGIIFKKLFFPSNEITIGEKGIFGFLFIYILTTISHFFFSISIYFSIFIFLLGFISLISNQKKLWKIFINLKKLFFFIIFLSLITAITNNLHDDVYLYQLPIINYFQQFKIIFGVIFLNDYVGQGHSFYEIMSAMQLPFIGNKAMYLLPVIFLTFFLFHIIESWKKVDYKEFKVFSLLIFLIFLFRFTRSKEFGTDIPVICLLFLIQIYLIDFLKNKENSFLFAKSAILFTFAVFLKLYAALAIFYILAFVVIDKNNLIDFFKKKRIICSIFLVIFISLTKNIITSGCLFYQLKNVCLDNKNYTWSIGNRAANERHAYTSASARGWKAYLRVIGHSKYIGPNEYLKISRYNYLKNIMHDKEFERFLVLASIFIIFLFILIFSKEKKTEDEVIFSFKKKINYIILLIALAPALIWIYKIPNLRYGGYAYLAFLFYTFLDFFKLNINVNFYKLKYFLIIGVIFFSTKNFVRINNEIKKLDIAQTTYPFAKFENFEFKQYNKNNFIIRKPTVSIWCGNIQMICASELEAINNVYKKNGYIFINGNEDGILKYINRTTFHDLFEMNDNPTQKIRSFNKKL